MSTITGNGDGSNLPGTGLDGWLKLLSLGYEPIPILAAEKRPMVTGWTTSPITEDRLRSWATQHPDHKSTGCRTGALVGVDVDLTDAGHADIVANAVQEVLGISMYERVGAKGCALYYKNETPIPKIRIFGTPPKGGKPQGVELFGTGGQMVVFGLHPSTKKPYRWENSTILDHPISELQEVTPDKLWECARVIHAELARLGYTNLPSIDDMVREPAAAEPQEHRGDPITPAMLESMLAYIDPGDTEVSGSWIAILCAIKYAPLIDAEDFDRLDLFIRWSAGDLNEAHAPGNFVDAADCADHWKSKKASDARGDGAGLGTIIHLARAGGYGEPIRVNYMERMLAGDLESSPPVGDMDPDQTIIQAPAEGSDYPDFQLTEKDKIAKNFHNALLAVRHLSPGPEYNQFLECVVMRDNAGRVLTLNDNLVRLVRLGIMEDYGLELSRDHVTEALMTVALDYPFHPVKDYFEGLTWDGTKRLDTWLTDYFHVADTEYARTVGRKWLLAGVTRIYNPGAKFDFMLVFVGGQGVAKSMALRVLSVKNDWFSDSPPDNLRPDNKDAILVMQGKLIIEFGELSGLKKTNRDTLKSFLSRQIDECRVPYARLPERFPRQCIFAGSTNEGSFLEDPTGGRRYWPVDMTRGGQLNVAGLRKVRDQLWAEVVAAFQGGETCALPERLWRVAGKVQESHHAVDPWEGKLRDYLDGETTRTEGAGPVKPQVRIHTNTLMAHALSIPTERQTSQTGKRIRPLMERLGWVYVPKLRIKDTIRPGYFDPEDVANDALRKGHGTGVAGW